jgi:Fe-S cluster assembly protein SufD
MSSPRIDVRLGSNSKATLVEHHIGAGAEANFTNAVIDIRVGEHAMLEHIRVQEDAVSNFNIGSIHATVASGASYLSHQYVFGASLARTDIHVALTGSEALTELHGLVFATQTQHLDVRTVIDHQVPSTRSIEDYRGVADHRGRVVFNGKVIVSKDAQKTDARQSSRNLLLSPQAEIDTRPELEIYANDVKCAHGATVGQLDAAALFYLQSRGVARDEAKALLTHAFAAEVIERIPVPVVREHVLSQLMARMRSGVTL